MSNIRSFAYRALMPRLYHHQSFREKFKGRISALAFPTMRVMAPFWSFGIVVKQLEEEEETSLPNTALSALRLIQELRRPLTHDEPSDQPPNHELGNLHRPQLWRAQMSNFYSYDFDEKKTQFFNDPAARYSSVSRLSIIGVHTLDGEQEGLNRTKLLDHTPVGSKDKPQGATSDLLLASIGGNPQSSAHGKAYLPACQLIGGLIGFRPKPHYLEMLRSKLGLQFDGGFANDNDQSLIYLLPDGFALFGKIHVPWTVGLEGQHTVSGWFKITPVAEPDYAGQAEMRIWDETPHPDTLLTGTLGWREALPQLRKLLFQSQSRARWLALSANAELGTDDLFWPVIQENGSFSFLMKREVPDDKRVHVRESALVVQLADRAQTKDALTVLTMKPKHFELAELDGALHLTTPVDVFAEANPPEAEQIFQYTFDDSNADENLTFDGGDSLELAIPLVQNSAELRAAQGMPTPVTQSHAPGLLWTFVPVSNGWLHLPFPNVTLDSLNRLGLPTSTSNLQDAEPRNRTTSGAFGFQNRPDAPGYVEKHRRWSFTLTDITRGDLDVIFDLATETITSASIKLTGGHVLFDGVLPITPFRQTPERLLPDHADRALASRSMLAISPSMLRDVEANAWAMKSDGAPVLRLSLEIKGLSFKSDLKTNTQDIDLQGGVTLVTDLNPQFLDTDDAARAPWLWIRQDKVPAVQNMPLGLAGDARQQPSGSRELAPLRLSGDIPSQMRYAFVDAMGMSKSAPLFAPAGEWLRPTEGFGWIDEIGMSLLTLPSISVFPGLTASEVGEVVDRLPADEFTWSQAVNTVSSAEVRHDLALNDETFGTASLPRSTPKEGDPPVVPNQRLFEPRADNGPNGSKSDGFTTSAWHRVWEGLQRDLALSATEQRGMISYQTSKKTFVLQGILGEHRTTVTPVFGELTDIKTERSDGHHSFNEEGPAPWVLTSVGQWGAILPKSADLGPFAGLPAEDDLVGLSGDLPLDRPASVSFGTATLDADEKGFFDQRGLHTGRVDPETAGLINRTLTIHTPDKMEKVPTITCKNPFQSKDAQYNTGLHLWFADVPLNTDRTKLHEHASLTTQGQPSERHKVNASSFENTPLQGYRWWLSDGSAPREDGAIVAAGIHFVPLTLKDVQINKGVLKKVTILGRPVLRLQAMGPEPKGTEGLVALNLDFEGEKFVASYTSYANSIIQWPLADPALFDRNAPFLQFTGWPSDDRNDPTPGTVRAALDELTFEVPVVTWFDKNGLLKIKVQDSAPPSTRETVLWPSVILFETGFDGQGALLATLDKPTLSIIGLVGGGDEWSLKPTLTLDLGQPGLPVLQAKGVLETKVLDPLKITAKSQSGTSLIGLDQNGLHLEWQTVEPNQMIGDAITVSSLSGVISVSLTPVPGPHLRLRVTTAVFEASANLHMRVSHAEEIEQTIGMRRSRGDKTFRLYGSLSLPNLLRWPDLNMPAEIPAGWTQFSVGANLQPAVTHLTTVQFQGQPFWGFAKGQAVLAVQVAHQLHWDGSLLPDVQWTTLQLLRLQSIADLREALLADAQQTNNAQADLTTMAISDALALGLDDLRAGELLYRREAGHHSALTGSLRDAWLEGTSNLTGLVVDLSGHHQLEWGTQQIGTTGPDWLNLPLPHLAVLTQDRMEVETTWLTQDLMEVETTWLTWIPGQALNAALSSVLSAQLTIHVHDMDLPTRHLFPRPQSKVLAAAHNRLTQISSKYPVGDIPAHALDLRGVLNSADLPEAAQIRSVFQSFSLFEDNGKPLLLTQIAPAIHHAVFLGVLKAQGLVAAPQAYALAAGGMAISMDPHENGTNMGVYARSLDRFAQRTAAHLVPVPVVQEDGQLNKVKAQNGVIDLTVYAARGGGAIRKIAQRFSSVSTNPEVDLERDLLWGAQTVLRLAPWTKFGTLTRRTPWNGKRQSYFLPHPGQEAAEIVRDTRPVSAQKRTLREVAQPQRLLPPEDIYTVLPARLAHGFSVTSSGAELWASENALIPGTNSSGPRLTATTAEVLWTLDGDPAPYLAGLDDSDLLTLHDRERVSFRESRAWKPGYLGQRMTTALPERYSAAMPAGLHPVALVPRRRIATLPAAQSQAIMPAHIFTARLASRAGVWAEARLGLDLNNLHASERPVNLRNPRPPLLAINDRPRASSQEEGHLAVSGNLTVILHGPRAARVGGVSPEEGLSRAPRSAWATVMSMHSPVEGLIDERWDGALQFKAVSGRGLENWTVKRADAHLDAGHFTAKLEKKATLESPLTEWSDPLTGQSLRAAAFAAPPATPIHVTLELVTNTDEGTMLYRQIRLELLVAGGGLGQTEAPVYLRFDDPEFNDRLTDIATSKSASFLVSTGVNELIFAADRQDVRPNDRLELIIGLRYGEIPLIDRTTFTSSDSQAYLLGELVTLSSERIRSGEDNLSYNLLTFESEEATDALSMGISLQHDLISDEIGRETDLKPEDQLVLRVIQGKKELTKLTFDVVATPFLPSNPSAFAHLQMKTNSSKESDTDLSISAPIYANSPVPTTVELVDPRDLLDGLVRRRAIYQWRSFYNRTEIYLHALQKRSGSGATWIDSDLAEGWSKLP